MFPIVHSIGSMGPAFHTSQVGEGVLLGILGGGLLPGVLEILTRFQTKKCNFLHPFSDKTSKIHTRLQTWPLGRSYVIIT